LIFIGLYFNNLSNPYKLKLGIGGFLADIFVSYSSDDRERVQVLIEQLQTAGFSTWWADPELRGGTLFSKEIEAEIEKAGVVVAV
jgi:hypothetical protein